MPLPIHCPLCHLLEYAGPGRAFGPGQDIDHRLLRWALHRKIEKAPLSRTTTAFRPIAHLEPIYRSLDSLDSHLPGTLPSEIRRCGRCGAAKGPWLSPFLPRVHTALLLTDTLLQGTTWALKNHWVVDDNNCLTEVHFIYS